MSVFARSQVQRAINLEGQVVTLKTKDVEGGYDPSTGTYTPETQEEFQVKVKLSEYTNDEMNNTAIVKGDKKVLCGTVDTLGGELPEITVGDFVNKAKVKAVQKIYSSGYLVCYILQVGE